MIFYKKIAYTLLLLYCSSASSSDWNAKNFYPAAISGDAQAQYKLAVCWFNGYGTEKNKQIAADYLMKSAAQNYPPAQYFLGMCYLHGNGVTKNHNAAVKQIKLAAQNDHPEAIFQMGMLYAEGKILKKNLKKAEKHLKKYLKKPAKRSCERAMEALVKIYAEQGITSENITFIENFLENKKQKNQLSPNAEYASLLYKLGIFYLKNLNNDPEKLKCALQYNSQAAQMGNKEAIFLIGLFFLKADSLKNPEKAFQYFITAADKGLGTAAFYAGECFYLGRGTTQNYAKAVQYYQKAAAGNEISEKEKIIANYRIGLCYLYGHGVKKAPASGIKLIIAAADAALPEAQYQTALCYLHGNGIEKNRAIAKDWFIKAAKQNHSDAAYQAGCWYRNEAQSSRGHSNKLFYQQEAFNWFKKASELGNKQACIEVAECYANGIGIEKSFQKALKYYSEYPEYCPPDTQYKIAQYYKEQKNDKEYIRYLTSAAESIYSAQFELGQVYFYGSHGVSKDYLQAEKYFKKSLKNSYAAEFELQYLEKCYKARGATDEADKVSAELRRIKNAQWEEKKRTFALMKKRAEDLFSDKDGEIAYKLATDLKYYAFLNDDERDKYLSTAAIKGHKKAISRLEFKRKMEFDLSSKTTFTNTATQYNSNNSRPVSSYNNDYHRQWDAAERASHTMEDEDVKLFIKAVKFYDKMERINRKMQRLNKKYSDNF